MKINLTKIKWVLFGILVVLIGITIPFLVKAADKVIVKTGNGLKVEYFSNAAATTPLQNATVTSANSTKTVYLKITNLSSNKATINTITNTLDTDLSLIFGQTKDITIEPNESTVISLKYSVSSLTNNKVYNATINLNYTIENVYNGSSATLKSFKKTTYFKVYYRGTNVIPSLKILEESSTLPEINADVTTTLVNDVNNVYFYGTVSNNKTDNVTYTANIYVNRSQYTKFQSGGLNLVFNIKNNNTGNYLNDNGKAASASWSGNSNGASVPTISSSLSNGDGISPSSSGTITLTGDLPTTSNSSTNAATLTIKVPVKCYKNGWGAIANQQGELTIVLNIYTYDTNTKTDLYNEFKSYEAAGFINEYSTTAKTTTYNNALSKAKEEYTKVDTSFGALKSAKDSLKSAYDDLIADSLVNIKILKVNNKFYTGDRKSTLSEEKTIYRLYNANASYTLPYDATYNTNSNRKTAKITGTAPATNGSIYAIKNYYYWTVDDAELKSLIEEANAIQEERYIESTVTNLKQVVTDVSTKIVNDSEIPQTQSEIDDAVQNMKTALNNLTVKTYTIKFIDWDQTIIKEEKYDYGTLPSCEIPTKESDEEYDYIFASWDKEITKAYEDKTYVAYYNKTIKKYDVTFKNDDGTVLETKKVEKHQIASYDGETPTKNADAEYTYTFAGWDKNFEEILEDIEYTATYTKTKNSYKVTFRSSDGDILLEKEYEYGDTIDYVQDDIITDEYTYKFLSWDRDFEPVTESTTYTATFDKTKNKYRIIFLNDDGTELKSEDVEYGKTPVAPTATKEKTAEYTYKFAGWDKEIEPVTKDATYKATYTKVKNKYTIKFVDDDNALIKEIKDIEYGATPSCDNPSKEADAEYTYTFAGWDSEVGIVTGNKTYKATYTKVKNKYRIIFLDDDGTELQNKEYEYGATPSCVNPTKEATAEYTYTFAGWDKEIKTVTKETTYKATYTKVKNKYRIIFLDDDGTELQNKEYEYGETPSCVNPTKEATAEYTYTFAGWDKEIKTVTKETTYKATYDAVANKYKIKYHTNGGSNIDEETVPYNTSIEAPTNPTKEGHKFVSWYSDENLTEKYTFEKMPAHDLNLYAKWEKNKYTINITVGNGITISPDERNIEVEYHDSKEYSINILRGYVLTGITINNVEYNLDSDNKIKLNSIEENKNIVIETRTLEPADYTRVDDLINQIPKNLDAYTKKTVNKLNEVLERLDRDLYETEQEVLDNYADELESAIKSLKLVGKIDKEDTSNENYGKADININDYQLADLFTEEEYQKILDGENAKIYLEVNDITKDISNTDKALIENKALKSKYELGLYLDINLFKEFEDNTPIKISQTQQKIKISLQIPNDLLNENKKVVRTYKVLRLHNGNVDILDCEVNGNKLSFETDKFSTYAIAYIDTKVSNNPATNDNLYSYLFMFMLGIFGITSTTLYIKRY